MTRNKLLLVAMGVIAASQSAAALIGRDYWMALTGLALLFLALSLWRIKD